MFEASVRPYLVRIKPGTSPTGPFNRREVTMTYLYGECQVCGKTVKVDTADGFVQPHAAQAEWSTTPPEHCAGTGHAPYEHSVSALAAHQAMLMQQANALALEHLNTAITENVDAHGRSWACVKLARSAFYPRGGVLWVLGRIMQTAPDTVQ